jgi:pimeloyl-ACP methyl ester carboxylesterase
MMRWIVRGLLGLLGLFVLLLVVALLYRTWRQHQNAAALAITTPPGISEASYVRIGGIAQWISIRGENRNNPVVLMLHGGPGGSMSAISAIFRNWEKDFTVVQWDQRGAGKTYTRNGSQEAPMTIERNVRDGIEVTRYVEQRLHKKAIILLGHSWGTELGVLMLKRAPQLFSAFVGTGFVVAKEEKEEILYRRLLARLKAAKDQDGLAKLEALGPPPYKSEHDQDIERSLSKQFDTEAERGLYSKMLPVALFAPDVTIRDLISIGAGTDYTAEALYRETLGYDARKLGPKFAMPFFIFNGDRDLVTPPDLVRPYFATIEAPKKAFVILKGGGHSALLTEPDVFLTEMKARVRPILN